MASGTERLSYCSNRRHTPHRRRRYCCILFSKEAIFGGFPFLQQNQLPCCRRPPQCLDARVRGEYCSQSVVAKKVAKTNQKSYKKGTLCHFEYLFNFASGHPEGAETVRVMAHRRKAAVSRRLTRATVCVVAASTNRVITLRKIISFVT